MANLKDMKKDKLVVLVKDLQEKNSALIEDFKSQGIVLVAANDALKEAKAQISKGRDELGKQLERVMELENLLPDQATPAPPEEKVMMVCLCDQVFTEMDRPVRYGYPGTPNERNDLVVEVPVSRVEAELGRTTNPLLTLEDYVAHVDQLQKIEEDLAADLDDDLDLDDLE